MKSDGTAMKSKGQNSEGNAMRFEETQRKGNALSRFEVR